MIIKSLILQHVLDFNRFVLLSLSVSNVCQFQSGACGEGHLCLPNGIGGRSCVCADADSEGSGEVDRCNDVF